MRKYGYREIQERYTEKVICNQCGKEIDAETVSLPAQYFSAEMTWGYGSEKDGETHAFDLCEDCYDKLIKGFVIPVTVME